MHTFSCILFVFVFKSCLLRLLNPFGPGNAICRYRSGSTLVQAMACRLTTPAIT